MISYCYASQSNTPSLYFLMPLILPPPSEQANDSEREPDGLRPAHTCGEAAARLFVGSFALPMERERAKPLEGRAAAAHVVCVGLGCGLR